MLLLPVALVFEYRGSQARETAHTAACPVTREALQACPITVLAMPLSKIQ
jgi:hypothetical protein